MIWSLIFMLLLSLFVLGDTLNHSEVRLKYKDEIEQKSTIWFNGKCINKCCPEGQFLGGKKCVKKNIKISFPVLDVYDEKIRKTGKKVADVLTVKSGRLLDAEFRNKSLNPIYLDDYRPYIIENGALQLEVPNLYDRWTLIPHQNYCVDYSLMRKGKEVFLRETPTFLVIFEDEYHRHGNPYSPFGMLVTCFFLLLVLLVYLVLPELQNICGKILMAYVFSLFMASLLMVTIEVTRGQNTAFTCIGLTSSIYFFLLATFCWMSVMSCDIWCTFRDYAKAQPVRRGKEHLKFLMYSLFAWGIPLAMTIALLALNNADMKHLPWFVTPQIPDRGCFLIGGVKFLYLYVPMLILITCNWVFYIMTAFYLWRLSRGTGILDSPKTSSGHNTQRNRFMMYLKLSIVMGLNWLFEIFSFEFPGYKIWYISDFFNIMIGVTIFLIYVCKREIYMKLRKRLGLDYAQLQSSSYKNCSSSSDECIIPQVISTSKGF